jgi:protein-S-isoprenylcysteine O-methyltransferase Ste14
VIRGRLYFAVQALAGAAWWVAVAISPFVREATLGRIDPVAVAVLDIPLFVVASAVAAVGVRSAAWIATVWTVVVAVALAGYATVTAEAGWGVLVMAAAAGCSLIALCLVARGRIPTEWIVAGPFAFRPAAPRSTALVHVATTFAQIVVFWGFFLVVLPVVVSSLERRWAVGFEWPWFTGAVGLVVLVLACALGISSAISMSVRGQGTPLPSAMPNRLVVAGPYRYIRNPMAVAGIVQGVAVGLMLGSWLVVAYALIGSLLWNYAVRPLEEVDLEERFGDDYRRYRDSVRCWVPRIPRPRAVAVP